MYPASAELKAAIQTDHIVVSKAEVWNQDQKLMTLDIVDGTVTVSNSSSIRRTCSVSLSVGRDSEIVPDTGFDALSPFGNELRLYRGVEFANGTREYVPLGIFRIVNVDIKDTNNGVEINVEGEDRSIIISRNKWTGPYQVLSGTLEAALTALLQNRYVDIKTDFPTTNVTVQKVILGTGREDDPWKDAVYLAQLVGYDLFFDVNGVCVMRQFPTLDAGVVVAKYEEGADTVALQLARTITSRETYNGVIYTVQGSERGAPIRVEVWDEDTTSPTYRYGVFGTVPIKIETNILSTQDEAIKAATSLLNTYIGAQEGINLDAIVDPTLDVNDVIYIKANGAKVDRLAIVDEMNVPLMPDGVQSVQTRIVRIVQDNEVITVGA